MTERIDNCTPRRNFEVSGPLTLGDKYAKDTGFGQEESFERFFDMIERTKSNEIQIHKEAKFFGEDYSVEQRLQELGIDNEFKIFYDNGDEKEIKYFSHCFDIEECPDSSNP